MKTTEFLVENEFIAQDADQMHKTHQHSMLREECYHLAVNAVAIHKLLGEMSEGEPVMAWAAEYISLANDHIKSVKEFLEYNDTESDMDSDMPEFDFADADHIIAEGLEDDILAMAKKISPTARIRGSREEEIARRDAMLAQRARDRANEPAPAKPKLSAEERASLEAELAELMPNYDSHYQMIDNYSQYKQAERIVDRVHQIQAKLKQGVAEGQRWPDDSNSLSKSDRDIELMNPKDADINWKDRKIATKIKPSITKTTVNRLDRDTTVPNFLKKGVAEGSSIMQGIRIQENATGGATGAASVGAVVTGLGEMPNAIIKRQKAYTNQRTKGGTVKVKQ
jgi:hypothetical protein